MNVTVSNFVKVNIRGAMNHNEGPVQPAWKFGNEMDDAVLGRPSFEHGTTAMALIPAGIWRRLVTWMETLYSKELHVDHVEGTSLDDAKTNAATLWNPLLTRVFSLLFQLCRSYNKISKWPKQESPTSFTLPTLRDTERDPVRAESPDVKEVMDLSESTESTWSVKLSANERSIWDSWSTVNQQTF